MAKKTNYLLRDIPTDLQREVKTAAAERGESVRDVLVRALERYAATARNRRLREHTKRMQNDVGQL